MFQANCLGLNTPTLTNGSSLIIHLSNTDLFQDFFLVFLLALFFTKFYVLIWSRSIRQRFNLLQLCKCLFSLTKSQMSKCDFFCFVRSILSLIRILKHFFSSISLSYLFIPYWTRFLSFLLLFRIFVGFFFFIFFVLFCKNLAQIY